MFGLLFVKAANLSATFVYEVKMYLTTNITIDVIKTLRLLNSVFGRIYWIDPCLLPSVSDILSPSLSLFPPFSADGSNSKSQTREK